MFLNFVNMKNIRLYGLIGYPLSHSFSQGYFTGKFAGEGYGDCFYRMFPLGKIGDLHNLLEQQRDLCGFNVTVPYKEQVVAYLDEIDTVAGKIGAVNTVQVIRNGKDIYLKGYNTDVYGFDRSLHEWFDAINRELPGQALVLGTGGASKAVVYALNCLNIVTNTVSRKFDKTYDLLNAADIAAHPLIVNTTPLGMFPNIGECPAIPYQYLTENHCLYDLVYNPEKTLFMRRGREFGALVHNGERMLHLQADRAWEIWRSILT